MSNKTADDCRPIDPMLVSGRVTGVSTTDREPGCEVLVAPTLKGSAYEHLELVEPTLKGSAYEHPELIQPTLKGSSAYEHLELIEPTLKGAAYEHVERVGRPFQGRH